MAAVQILKRKVLLKHKSGKLGIFEIVAWDVGKSSAYPDGVKYRAWLVMNGKTVLGFDNHKPKGPHIHKGTKELPYEYAGLDQLRSDMKRLIEFEGFEYET